MNIDFLEQKRKEKDLTQEYIGKILGMGKASYQKIEKGINNLHSKHWKKINSILGTTTDDLATFTAYVAVKRRQEREGTLKILPEIELVQKSGAEVPLVSEAAAAECNPGIMPLIDCVSQYAEDKIYFSEGKNGDFAIKVIGCSMLPWYPPGTTLLVRPFQELRNGQRVIAVLDEGEIIFKVFVRGKHKIGLVSINGEGGQDYEFPLNGKGIRYLCQVIASQRNEDKLDDAMRAAGIHHSWEEKLKNL